MSEPAYTLSDDNTDAAAIGRALIGPAALIAASLAIIGGYRSRARIGAWVIGKLVDAIEIREIIIDTAAGDSE